MRDDRNATQRGMGGFQISPQATMRRITQNGILEAAKQLRDHGRGAVVLYCDLPPPRNLVDVVLGGLNRADTSLLQSVGLVVIPSSLGASPVIWRNPLVTDDSACEKLAASFAEILGRTHERVVVPSRPPSRLPDLESK